MKTLFTITFLSFTFALFSQANTNTQWTWMKGDSTTNKFAVYGTKSVAASPNKPGGRWGCAAWKDLSGNLWLMGGIGYGGTNYGGNLNDLWKYDPLVNLWTWVGGDTTSDRLTVYGSPGVAAPTNKPGGRTFAISWTDLSGNFWFFGGQGSVASINSASFNDLWKYNVSINQWTWVKGDSGITNSAVYGVKGLPAAANKPAARYYSISWTDASGNLWLFGGGQGAANFNSASSSLNDLWKYNPSSNQWTWVNGDTSINNNSVYGVQGITSPTNKPGARYGSVSWKDASGNLWLFGGQGYTVGNAGSLNDLWKYDPSIDAWTWISGDSTINNSSIYGTQGLAAATNKPGARFFSISWTDQLGNFWLMGGAQGINTTGPVVSLNDLWKYNPSTNQWTWVKGDNTANGASVYGTQETAATANKPGARYKAISWVDASGNSWLYGSLGYTASRVGFLNDLWKLPGFAIVTPVTIKSMKAYQLRGDILVEWKVENETGIRRYEVEKSPDGNAFRHVANIKATGNNLSSVDYSWLDVNAPGGNNFYRIKSVETNGKTEYGAIVNVLIGRSKPSISVYPNPVKDGVIYLRMNNMPEGNYHVRLMNNIGQTMIRKTILHGAGSSTEIITSGTNPAKGSYQLEVTNLDGTKSIMRIIY